MNRPDFDQLRDTLRHRALTPDEMCELDTWFAAHPDDATDWKTNRTLDGALGRLPVIEPSSNFNALVLNAVSRSVRTNRPPLWWLRVRRLIQPALAAAIVLLLIKVAHHENATPPTVDERILATLANVDVPSVDVLLDYTVIREYQGAQIEPDTDLLLALQ